MQTFRSIKRKRETAKLTETRNQTGDISTNATEIFKNYKTIYNYANKLNNQERMYEFLKHTIFQD